MTIRYSVLLSLLLCPWATSAITQDPMLQMIPVRTPELTPGKVVSRTLPQTVSTPLFIVGDDALSHRWLKEKQTYLQRIHATGIVVQVANASGWARIKQYSLPMYPVQGRDFAKAFHLQHYPVLIERKQIKQ